MSDRLFARSTRDRPAWYISPSDITNLAASPIGRGGFGEVLTGTYFGSKVAIKRLLGSYNNRELAEYNHEIDIWKHLSHPNILPLLGACDKDDDDSQVSPFMVSPFMANGTLRKYVSDNTVTVEDKLRLLYQVASGLAYLHGRRIVHGDLKAANVLLDNSFNAVVADFGLSSTKHTSASFNRTRIHRPDGGTEGYMAPEMFDEDDPSGSSLKTDVYSFAITMYEVLNDSKPVWVTANGQAMKPAQILSQIFQNKRPKRLDGVPDDIWLLIESCWAQEPADRPSFSEILAVLEPYSSPSLGPVLNSGIASTAAPSAGSESHSPLDGLDSHPMISRLVLRRARMGNDDACIEIARTITDGKLASDPIWKKASAIIQSVFESKDVNTCVEVVRKVTRDRPPSDPFWAQIADMFQLITKDMCPDARNELFRRITDGRPPVDSMWFAASSVVNQISDEMSAETCLALATTLTDGVDATDPVWSKAALYFQAAANHENLEAYFYLGWMHFIGLGVPQKDVDALDYWQEVSTKSTNTMHKPIATHMLGWMHYLGRGTQRDEPKGVKLIRSNKSDEFPLGEENSLAAYGLTCSEELAACKFFELCRLGSDQEWLCRHLMAVCLVQGFGTGKDQKKAAGIFAQLAAQNHGDSQHWLGTCHLCGWGAPKDESKSFQWYSSSASQDNSYGHYRLGGCYFRGWGVAQSQTMALKSFRKSVEHGNRYGQYQIGFCHQFGIAASKNIGTAIFWYRKSAQQGNDYAVKRLEKLGK